MVRAGQAIFSRMDEVQFGKPAAATVADLVKRNGAERVFLMVSGTLIARPTRLLVSAARSATASPESSIGCRHIHRGRQ
jgi:hypothetical protein